MSDDPIKRPPHYARWEIEPIKFIMANDLPFWLGHVIKYGMRYDAKSGLEDLRKARQYLDFKIEEMEAAEPVNASTSAGTPRFHLP